MHYLKRYQRDYFPIRPSWKIEFALSVKGKLFDKGYGRSRLLFDAKCTESMFGIKGY